MDQKINLRYERKLSSKDVSADDFEKMIKFHPAMFSEIFYPRPINNIYFDSNKMCCYFANIDGLDERVKIRIRWYGDLFGAVENPVLELKIKKDKLGYKIRYPLNSFSLDEQLSIYTIRQLFKQADIPEVLKLKLMNLDFSLLNSYRRKYFLSADKNFRITIDSDLKFYRLDPMQNYFLNSFNCHDIILEIKYNESMQKQAHDITNSFLLRIDKYSKYINGVKRISV